MFAHPLWSLLLIATPIIVYFVVIRWHRGAHFLETAKEVDGWLARQWARIVAFRTPVIGALFAFATGLPDLLVQVFTSLDFSGLPQPWPMYTAITGLVLTNVMKAFEAKPDGVKAA